MTNWALIVGSQTGELRGPVGDAERIAAVLQDRGFEVDLRVTRENASRDGILAGYRQLIDRTHPGDAAVVYYSGHGVRVPSPPGKRRAPTSG